LKRHEFNVLVLTKTFIMRNLALASLLITSSITNSTISNSIPTSRKKMFVSNKLDFVDEALLTTTKANEYLKKELNIITNELPLCLPLDIKGFKRVSGYYGNRKHPILNKWRMHKGIDFAGKLNTDIYAAGDGIVKSVRYSSGYGLCVVITHGNGLSTVYGHLNDATVKKGDVVKASQKIGLLGNTGISTGPHLHFEIKVKKRSIDPLKLLNCNRDNFIQKMLTFKNFKKWENQNYFLTIS